MLRRWRQFREFKFSCILLHVVKTHFRRRAARRPPARVIVPRAENNVGNPKAPHQPKTSAKTRAPVGTAAAASTKTPVCKREVVEGGKTATTCKPVKSDKCADQLGCGQCTLAKCGFNKQTMTCLPKSAHPMLITGGATVPKACLPINQMQDVSALFLRKRTS